MVLGDLFKAYAASPKVTDPRTPARTYSSVNWIPGGLAGGGFGVGFGGTECQRFVPVMARVNVKVPELVALALLYTNCSLSNIPVYLSQE